ncbi:MAG TPA: ferrochelatase [Planktothrix sp.]
MESIDAFLLVSFGGPEGIDDVMPFLRNVVKGRNVPDERLKEVAKQYELFGGVSPINQQNRLLIEKLQQEFKQSGVRLPIYWGNRNWQPMLADTVRQMKADGITRALAFVTSAFSSYSGCRQYLEDIERARTEVGDGAPEILKVRAFWNHPGFIEPVAENVRAALNKFGNGETGTVPVVFTAHSIPKAMADNCAYEEQLKEACAMVMQRVGDNPWSLAFQSRSGPPTQPWLEPDIGDQLQQLSATGTKKVVVMPIGFVSDHMEVLFDLDTKAQQTARELGMHMQRAATVGVHPQFISMIRELVQEGTPPACRPDCCNYTPHGR